MMKDERKYCMVALYKWMLLKNNICLIDGKKLSGSKSCDNNARAMCSYLLFYWSSRPWTYVKEEQSEPVFVNLLRSPGIDSQPGGIDPRNRFLGSIRIRTLTIRFSSRRRMPSRSDTYDWLFQGGGCHQKVIWLSVAGQGCRQGAIWLAVPVGKSPGSDLIGCLFCSGTRRCASPRKGGRRSPELCNLDLHNCAFKSKSYLYDVNVR